jgi:hypothetical protein
MRIASLLAFLVSLIFANVALAQSQLIETNTFGIPDTDWTRWNIFGLNAVVLARVLGEIYSSLKNGGGLVGVWRAIIYGQNVPKAIASDYHEELKPPEIT